MSKKAWSIGICALIAGSLIAVASQWPRRRPQSSTPRRAARRILDDAATGNWLQSQDSGNTHLA